MSKSIPSVPEITDLFDHSPFHSEAERSSKPNPQTDQFEGKTSAFTNIRDPHIPILAPADERYLSDKQVAERFGVSRPTIWRWVKTEKAFPHPVSLSSGTSRWRLSDLLVYEAKLEKESHETPSMALGKSSETVAPAAYS